LNVIVFADVLLPVFLVGASGFALGRLTRIGSESLVKVVFYILQPALIFQALFTGVVVGDTISTTILFVLLFHVTLVATGSLGQLALRWDERKNLAMLLSLSFNNTGAYALPILLFAFGKQGLALGVVYLVAHSVLQATLAVGIASWRRGSSLLSSAKSILTVPWIYAVILAVILRSAGVTIPNALTRSLDLLSSAAIPMQLVLLGLQFSEVRLASVFREAAPIALVKLVAPPLIAVGLAAILGIHGLILGVLLVQASAPTAINSLLLAIRYDCRPDLVAAIVLLTTVGSVLTIGLLLSFIT